MTYNLDEGGDWKLIICDCNMPEPYIGGYTLTFEISPIIEWYRLQIKFSGQYLDAYNCLNTVKLNPGSNHDNGACQLWRFVDAGEWMEPTPAKA